MGADEAGNDVGTEGTGGGEPCAGPHELSLRFHSGSGRDLSIVWQRATKTHVRTSGNRKDR